MCMFEVRDAPSHKENLKSVCLIWWIKRQGRMRKSNISWKKKKLWGSWMLQWHSATFRCSVVLDWPCELSFCSSHVLQGCEPSLNAPRLLIYLAYMSRRLCTLIQAWRKISQTQKRKVWSFARLPSVVLLHKASHTGWVGRHEHAATSSLTSLSENQVLLFQGVPGVSKSVCLKTDFVGPALKW